MIRAGAMMHRRKMIESKPLAGFGKEDFHFLRRMLREGLLHLLTVRAG